MREYKTSVVRSLFGWLAVLCFLGFAAWLLDLLPFAVPDWVPATLFLGILAGAAFGYLSE